MPDAVPLPRVVNERIERKAAYETTKADIAKWQPIVKENREKPTLNFVGVERDKMHRKKSLASINTDFVPENDFEKEIMRHLKEANALTGQDVERAEDLARDGRESVGRQRAGLRDEIAEAAAVHEGHRDLDRALGVADALVLH